MERARILYFLNSQNFSYTPVHMSAGWLVLRGARGNNLMSIDVAIPVGWFTCITGVSGSGKRTPIQGAIYRRLL